MRHNLFIHKIRSRKEPFGSEKSRLRMARSRKEAKSQTMSGIVNGFDLIKEGQKLVTVRCEVLMTNKVFGKNNS